MWPFSRRLPPKPTEGVGKNEQPETPKGYRIFTTEFDEIITVPQLAARLEPLFPEQQAMYARDRALYRKMFPEERLELIEHSAPLIRDIVTSLSLEERQRTAVTILIDHSGSMAGNRIVSAMVAAQHASEFLGHCMIDCEIIGFTTKSWRGGLSREKWKRAGKPGNPGRLCDLRYILYKEAGKRALATFSEALYPGLLKENVDGEALELAARRLSTGHWERKAIVFLSDGTPVDDSTLSANSNREILVDHLVSVEQTLREQGIATGYVLLAEECNYRDFEIASQGYEPLTTGKALLDVIARTLAASTKQPISEGGIS